MIMWREALHSGLLEALLASELNIRIYLMNLGQCGFCAYVFFAHRPFKLIILPYSLCPHPILRFATLWNLLKRRMPSKRPRRTRKTCEQKPVEYLSKENGFIEQTEVLSSIKSQWLLMSDTSSISSCFPKLWNLCRTGYTSKWCSPEI